jgi:hypothetical protein
MLQYDQYARQIKTFFSMISHVRDCFKCIRNYYSKWTHKTLFLPNFNFWNRKTRNCINYRTCHRFFFISYSAKLRSNELSRRRMFSLQNRTSYKNRRSGICSCWPNSWIKPTFYLRKFTQTRSMLLLLMRRRTSNWSYKIQLWHRYWNWNHVHLFFSITV